MTATSHNLSLLDDRWLTTQEAATYIGVKVDPVQMEAAWPGSLLFGRAWTRPALPPVRSAGLHGHQNGYQYARGEDGAARAQVFRGRPIHAASRWTACPERSQLRPQLKPVSLHTSDLQEVMGLVPDGGGSLAVLLRKEFRIHAPDDVGIVRLPVGTALVLSLIHI